MRAVSIEDRRRALVRRHHLAGDAEDPEAVVRALVALHATDPASVYLSVLARSARTTLDDVFDAMYRRRSLVRWMAMRRTLFVFSRQDVPTVQAAVSTPLAAVLRRRLVGQLEHNGSNSPIAGDVEAWVLDLERRVSTALERRGTATGAQLREDEPALATKLEPRAPSDRPQSITSSLLTVMSAEGAMVRSVPTGAWTSRHHRWAPVSSWWPSGLPARDPAEARQDLARRWLERFGPATVEDLRWWTGWNKTVTTAALESLPTEEVDLHGVPGIDLAVPEDADDPVADPVGMAALLPALDPTPMGWKHREWFFGFDPSPLFDRAGNIGPTLWWEGEIIGSWGVAQDGELRTAIVADRGSEASDAVDRATARLQERLDGASITPAARTPLELELTRVA